MVKLALIAATFALLGTSATPDAVDGLWLYTLARCPEADVLPQGYSQLLVIQGQDAAQETYVDGCASQTRVMKRLWTPDGPMLRYAGAVTTCTPGPACFGGFHTTIGTRVAAASFSCSSGAAWGEVGPLQLSGPDVLEVPVPGERGCTSVYTRVPGPTGALP